MIDMLYKVTATGAINIWEVRQLPNSGSLVIRWGQRHGAMQSQQIDVAENQSGRSLADQVRLEAQSRINRQLDKGYCLTIDEAQKSIGLNASKMLKPMLAVKYRDVNVDHMKCFIQFKYNGHRCLIASTVDGIVAYSRNGKPIPGISHITDYLDLEVGTVLDGEIYAHGVSLQDIGSLARKQQLGSEKLNFVCYDMISDHPFEKRLNIIIKMNFGGPIKMAPTIYGINVPDLYEHLDTAMHHGYEGLMLRTNNKGYEPGKRSNQLIKVKKPDDCEVIILDVIESKDGWAILECVTLDTIRKFRVSAPGTIEEKTRILHNPAHYVGKLLTIEHFGLTNDLVPFHPVAISIREDL